MLGTLAATVTLAFASTSAAPPHHHRQAVNHRHGCRSLACDKRADVAFDRHRKRKLERELASGWAIPTYIVMCESKGRNEPPNEAGAAGYYQITEWHEKGGSGAPYANEHSKAEQDAMAARIWDGGRGASQWDCA